ncbi:MAG TPA: xanthine dehydrogenase family protein molybdopterin-binding subunit [Candidatus Acidoferrales bacterium]|nr:xanthine dehydrogenase family protein molybdopterin-binding subunit [Candidatus Acidoferrales bacterium]
MELKKASFSTVGAPVPRAEGPDKVSGCAIYAADVKLPGLCWGKILRSPYAHARIRRIDASRAEKLSGVIAVVTGRDIPGRYMGKMIRDMPVLCWDRVRFIGDRVAAVAAETADIAEEALSLIDVEYEELPAVFDPLEAMKADAPLIHEDVSAYDGAPRERLALDVRNGLTRLAWRKGDVEKGFRGSSLVLEHTFTIPGRHQGYLEPHAGVVAVDAEGRIQVWASTKNSFGTRAQLAKAIGVAEERIRINVVNVGGEFGGKGDALDLPVAYFLARKCGRPVKIVMTYSEELTASNPAHPTVITVRSGVTKDGRILARSIRAFHASGAYGALKSNASLATWHYAGGLYRVENAALEFLQIYTNTVPGGYYRSPGAIATFFALESHTDIVARALGMDPGEFRLKNLLTEGEEDAIGQRLHGVRFRDVLKACLAAAGWKKAKRRPNYGRGIAIYGRHISGGDTGVVLSLETDGAFSVLSPTFDQGAGTHTILRQLVAEDMGVSIERVRVSIGDTDSAPRDSGARASRVTYVAGRAVLGACSELRAVMLSEAARVLECKPEEVDFSAGKFRLRQDPGQELDLRQLARRVGRLSRTVRVDLPPPDEVTYVCAQVAEVEIDPETGKLAVPRIVTAHDVGTIINPITHQGQIDGGAVMGFGQAVMEELVLEDGRVLNANLGDYKMPTVADIPKLKTVLVPSGGGLAPYEAKAIGEFANNSPPAAIANAVADAVGVRIFELPITSEKIYRALSERKASALAPRKVS